MPPRLYLLRHADAVDAANDAVRALSAKGRHQITRLACLLRPTAAFVPVVIWHSPLERARETADRLATELRLNAKQVEDRDLEPEADPAAVARKLRLVGQALALVGHEPHLSALASLLVTGSTTPIVFTIRKATLLALEPAGDRWSVAWQISPEIAG